MCAWRFLVCACLTTCVHAHSLEGTLIVLPPKMCLHIFHSKLSKMLHKRLQDAGTSLLVSLSNHRGVISAWLLLSHSLMDVNCLIINRCDSSQEKGGRCSSSIVVTETPTSSKDLQIQQCHPTGVLRLFILISQPCLSRRLHPAAGVYRPRDPFGSTWYSSVQYLSSANWIHTGISRNLQSFQSCLLPQLKGFCVQIISI